MTPQLEYSDNQNNFIIYKFIEGRFLSQNELTKQAIEKAINFYASLVTATKHSADYHIIQAAESCLSMKEYMENIQLRIEK